MEKINLNGIWWLPDAPEARISGILNYDPNEGIFLELIGTFSNLISYDQNRSYDIVIGVSTNGKMVTLYNCMEIKRSLSIPGVESSRIRADLLLFGHHFEKIEDIKFDEIYIGYSLLDDWTNFKFYDIEYRKNEKDKMRSISIHSREPKSYETIYNEFKISLISDLSMKGDLKNELLFKGSPYFKIEGKENIYLTSIFRINHLLKGIISLGVGKPVHNLFIHCRNNNIYEEYKGKKYYTSIILYYKLKEYSEGIKIQTWNEMLFLFRDINDNFSRVINNWISKYDNLKPVYNLYLATINKGEIFSEDLFLNVIHAIEAYHAKVYDAKYLSDDEYEEVYGMLISSIPQEIPEDFRSRVKHSLKYLNEYSLRKRLKEILRSIGDIHKNYIDNDDEFINKIVNTRNYFTHYTDDLKEKAITDLVELYYETQRLRIVLEICIMKELGFTIENIKEIFKRTQKYEYLKIRNYQ